MRTRIAHRWSLGRRALLAVAAMLALAGPLGLKVVNAGGAQNVATPGNSKEASAAFEAVSVRASDPKAGPGLSFGPCSSLRMDAKRFAITATPQSLIAMAYGKPDIVCSRWTDFFVGGPDWIRSERYDIEAIRTESSPSNTAGLMIPRAVPGLQLMLQTLLADRFKLKVHSETKEFSQYVLTTEEGFRPGTESGGTAWLARRLDQSGRPYGEIRADRTPMPTFVSTLQGIVGVPVQDKTGLKGFINATVEFDNNGVARPPLAAALQQIGLKLERTVISMEVLVIDSVERLVEDSRQR